MKVTGQVLNVILVNLTTLGTTVMFSVNLVLLGTVVIKEKRSV